MSRSRRKIPSYRLHKASGQAVVTLNGKDVYLGRYGTPESRAEYDRVIAEWLASGKRLPDASATTLTVEELLNVYRTFAEAYYVVPRLTGDGTRSGPMLSRIRQAVAPLLELYGHTSATQFGPLALKTIRQRYVEHGYARTHINQLVGTVQRIFRWAAGEELVPAGVYESLRTVDGLRTGKTTAKENPPVEPVPEEDIEAVRRVLALRVVRDLIDLQLLTAARPGELLGLCPADVDRSGPVWLARLRIHKTAHHGHERIILIGPRGQEVLAPYLDGRDPQQWCFSPREAVAAYQEDRGRSTVTMAGERYGTSSYTRAIRRACLLAGVPPWHAHQLRHNAATRLTDEFGIELARIILGHARLDATQLYAKVNLAKAIEAVGKIG